MLREPSTGSGKEIAVKPLGQNALIHFVSHPRPSGEGTLIGTFAPRRLPAKSNARFSGSVPVSYTHLRAHET